MFNSNEMTAIQKEEHRKLLQRERAKRFYDKNKEKILEKSRLEYAIENGVCKLETDNEVINSVKKIIKEDTRINPATGENIINAMKVWSNVLKINTITGFKNKVMTNPYEVIDKIDSAGYGKECKEYSNNSKRNYLSNLLYICQALEIKLPKKAETAYKNSIEKMNVLNTAKMLKRNESEKETLPTFEEYIQRVRQIYPETSLQMLLIYLYSELTCRDDYGRLIIINDAKKAVGTKNYIFVGKRDVKVILNQFKTDKVYKKIQSMLSYELANKVKAYITANGMNINDELFPYDNMSAIVCEINKRIGLDGGINTLRRIAVKTENVNENSTLEDKQELSKKMGHTLHIQQLGYSNNIMNLI